MPTAIIQQTNIRYEVRGVGLPLVLLHGIGGNIRLWRRQMEGLADAFKLIVWDAPGYGGSDDPDGDWEMEDYAGRLAGLLDHLGIERAHLMGQSWGGVLAQVFYRRHPERVRSLILADTFAGGGSLPEEEREASLRARLDALATMTPAEMARRRAPVLLSEDVSEDLLREVESILAEIHPAGYRQAAIASSRADTRDVHARIAVPTLIIAAEQDRVVPPERARQMHAAIPGSRLVMIENSGHLPSVEQSEAFNRAVREFLSHIDRS